MSADNLTTTESPGQILRRINSLKAQISDIERKHGNQNVRLDQMKKAMTRLLAQHALMTSAAPAPAVPAPIAAATAA
jgi:peptidoglycan hydrolase CwlO-like protein